MRCASKLCRKKQQIGRSGMMKKVKMNASLWMQYQGSVLQRQTLWVTILKILE